MRREKDRSRSESHGRHQGALNHVPSRHPRRVQNSHAHARETSKRVIHRFPHCPLRTGEPASMRPASPLQHSKCQMRLSTWQADVLRHAPRSPQHVLLRTIMDHLDRGRGARRAWDWGQLPDRDQLTGGPRPDGEGSQTQCPLSSQRPHPVWVRTRPRVQGTRQLGTRSLLTAASVRPRLSVPDVADSRAGEEGLEKAIRGNGRDRSAGTHHRNRCC